MANSNQSYLVPGAIVLAGLLIAGAVIYTNNPSNGGNGDGAGGEAAAVSVVGTAEAIGLDKKEFEKCVDERRHKDAVQADRLDAQNAGGTGTPYSVLVAANGSKYPVFGAVPYDQLKQIIDSVLAEDTSALDALEAEAGGAVGDMAPVTSDDHIRGNLDAPLKIVEYSDLECPFCARFHPTAQRAVDEYDGQVAWVYRHLPLDNIHPLATPLAEGSECAAELGGDDAFWAYIDEVFSS